MAAGSLPSTLVLDTNCLVYRLDDPDGARGRWLDDNVFPAAVGGRLRLIVASVALAEPLVRPYADGQPQRAQAVRRALETLPGLTVVELSTAVADIAARVRAGTGLPLPDAVMLATAEPSGASLLTNHRQLVHPASPAPVLVLDDERGQPGTPRHPHTRSRAGSPRRRSCLPTLAGVRLRESGSTSSPAVPPAGPPPVPDPALVATSQPE